MPRVGFNAPQLIIALVLCSLLQRPFLYAQFLPPDDIPLPNLSPEVPKPPEAAPVAPPPPPPPPPPVAQPPQATVYPPVSQPPDSLFHDFAAYSRPKNNILTWHLQGGRLIERRVQIYRFTEVPRVIHDISKGILIAKLTGEVNIYEDVPPTNGIYYYSIFVETPKGLEPSEFIFSRNLVGPVSFVTGAPVEKPAEVKTTRPHYTPTSESLFARSEYEDRDIMTDEHEPDFETDLKIEPKPIPKPQVKPDETRGINRIIKKTYFRKDYETCIEKLKPFLKNTDVAVRAKSMFYIGLSYYHLEKYSKAQKYFNHALVRKAYARHSRFWLKQTQENLREP